MDTPKTSTSSDHFNIEVALAYLCNVPASTFSDRCHVKLDDAFHFATRAIYHQKEPLLSFYLQNSLEFGGYKSAIHFYLATHNLTGQLQNQPTVGLPENNIAQKYPLAARHIYSTVFEPCLQVLNRSIGLDVAVKYDFLKLPDKQCAEKQDLVVQSYLCKELILLYNSQQQIPWCSLKTAMYNAGVEIMKIFIPTLQIFNPDLKIELSDRYTYCQRENHLDESFAPANPFGLSETLLTFLEHNGIYCIGDLSHKSKSLVVKSMSKSHREEIDMLLARYNSSLETKSSESGK